MSGRLADKRALITNLPAGAIAAVAERCLSEGAEVIVASSEPLADLPARARQVQHDGTKPAAWDNLREQISKDPGGLDILIQGLTAHHDAPIADTSLQQFRAMNTQNLEATFLATQAAFRLMAGKGGAIVNVGSAFGLLGAANAGGLCAGAGGLKMLTKAAGVEGVTGDAKIRVNCILAGDVEARNSCRGIRTADDATHVIVRCRYHFHETTGQVKTAVGATLDHALEFCSDGVAPKVSHLDVQSAVGCRASGPHLRVHRA